GRRGQARRSPTRALHRPEGLRRGARPPARPGPLPGRRSAPAQLAAAGGVRIKFWGTRGTRPTPGGSTLHYGGNTPCVEVRTESGALIILDSGSGIAEFGNTLDGPIDAHLLISHTHWDHIQGFPFFAPNFRHGSTLKVIGPQASMKSLQGAFADQMDPAYFPVNLYEMPVELEFVEMAPDDVFMAVGVKIVADDVNHPIVVYCYRLYANAYTLYVVTIIDHQRD